MTDDSLLAQLAEDFVAGLRAGKKVEIEEYARRYPKLAERIRELFPILMLLEGMDPTTSREHTRQLDQPGFPPNTMLNHFCIKQEIGRGGMGVVYQAVDQRLGRDVAIKVLPQEYARDADRVARFQREAKLLASLNHPNIAGIYGLEQADKNRFLVLEYVEGETLQSRLNKGALPLDEALALCRQIVEGLEAAHEKGIIHRDLKPANVMITAGGKVKILDFGLAKALVDEVLTVDSLPSTVLSEVMTRLGVILGTAAYMSPEQAKGKSVDRRADIWAFGCILYECLAGKKAFEGETATEVLASILKEEPDWKAIPPAMLPNIRYALRRCLKRDVSQRFHHASDLRIALEETYDFGESAPQRKRPLLPWIIAAVAFLALIAVGSTYFQREQPAPLKSMSFQIVPPVNLAPGASFALSPDGQYLVFVAIGSDGVQQLCLRPIGSDEIRPLLNLESHFIPPLFWSPDSRYIVFQAGGKLKKLDIQGGPPQALCAESRRVVGGAWNSDGVILFGTAGGNIMRVSSNGGQALPVTKIDPSGKESTHCYPSFIDRKHFLYFCNSSLPESNGIYIGSLESTTAEQLPKKLLQSSSQAEYLPSQNSGTGYLLFLRDQILMAQRFDSKIQKLIGEAVPLANKSDRFSLFFSFFSASKNGILVYRSGQGAQPRHLTWFDRQGTPKQSQGVPGFYAGVAVAPDGTQAAVGLIKASPSVAFSDIWLYDFLRGTNARFIFGQHACRNPVWSPDMNRIVYSSAQSSGWTLFQKRVDIPKDEEPLLKPSGDNFPTSWSADGRFLLFNDWDRKTWSGNISVLPIGGDHQPVPFLNTEFNELDGHFSPDMRWVAYTSDESGGDEIYIREFEKSSGKTSRASARKWLVSKNGGMGARWREDGKELYYRTFGGNVMSVELKTGTILNVGTPKLLFQAPPDLSEQSILYAYPSWDVTADGKLFLIPTPVSESSQAPFTVMLNWTSLLGQ